MSIGIVQISSNTGAAKSGIAVLEYYTQVIMFDFLDMFDDQFYG